MFRAVRGGGIGGMAGRGGGRMAGAVGPGATMTRDPAMKRCRVFVGNLNTLKITKQQVEETFSQYGTVQAVTVFKGYAFVQYLDEMEARLAAESEDGRSYAGQVIDCNLASEPKQKQLQRKRAPPMGGGESSGWPAGGPVAKVPRMGGGGAPSFGARGGRNLVSLTSSGGHPAEVRPVAQPVKPKINLTGMHSYASSDVLFCGNCKESFGNAHGFVEHKKTPCKLKNTCECRPEDAPEVFVCATCGEEFRTCWSLVQHCQTAHEMLIYVEHTGTVAAEGEGEQQETEEADNGVKLETRKRGAASTE